jgi:hypothetical protein
MAQRDYEEQPEAEEAAVHTTEEPDAPAEELGATRIDRAPDSGGAGAAVDGREDAGPDMWR